MSDRYVYIPITITVWKGDVCLFQCDCEAKCKWNLPDGPSGPIDWDVTAFWFDNVGTEPHKRRIVEIYKPEPLFGVLYADMDREWIGDQLREALARDGLVNLYQAPDHD